MLNFQKIIFLSSIKFIFSIIIIKNKIWKVSILSIFFITVPSFSGNTQENDYAKGNKILENYIVKYNTLNNTILFIKPHKDLYIEESEQIIWLKNILKLTVNFDIIFSKKTTDKLGYTHYTYKINYKGIPLENAVYYIHCNQNKIISANGDFFPIEEIDIEPQVEKLTALNKAIDASGVKIFDWELNHSIREPKPEGTLVIINTKGKTSLAYRFEIFAINPFSRKYYYVDAHNGEIIKTRNLIQTTDVIGTAVTKYNGIKHITTDSSSGIYTLKESGRGEGIETYNLNHDIFLNGALNITDDDNYWNDTLENNNAIYDAHYGAEISYDYFWETFGRNSYDGEGSKLTNYVHFGNQYCNAFWNFNCLVYGDGDGINYTPFTSLEIVAHEYTHGVTQHTADLLYEQESGALNESFSDIFGTTIDFFANPNTANFEIGEQISISGNPYRSMSEPNKYECPDTYLGKFWNLNNAVHINSGVQNYWFYLLSNGGSGINDIGSVFAIDGIGIEKAAQIAYRTLTYYLTPNSTYADARFFSIIAAKEIFGTCSLEEIAVTNSWYAVGVGKKYDNTVTADFYASSVFKCRVPSTIEFENNTSPIATKFLWSFGDGTFSTEKNPAHTYTSDGTYPVCLIASANELCGGDSDTILKTKYITITDAGGPTPPLVKPNTLATNPDNGILQFKFQLINNSSNGAKEGFEDFTCNDSTWVEEGDIKPVFINTSGIDTSCVWVWVDFNNDGKFIDSTELVFYSKNKNIHTGNIVIPKAIVYNKFLILRVGSDKNGYSLINGNTHSHFGQYEDYSIKIIPTFSAPISDFITKDTIIKFGDTIAFNNQSLYLPTSWEWLFPGGNPSSSLLQNPSIIYNSVGDYDVTLITTNAFGKDTLTRKNYIHVVNPLSMCSSNSSTSSYGILFDSGGIDGNYNKNERCHFLIDNCSAEITLSFTSFNTEKKYDYLNVYDGENINGKLLFNGSGLINPFTLKALSGEIFITFHSDEYINEPGFCAYWSSSKINGKIPFSSFIVDNTNPPLNTPVCFMNQSDSNSNKYEWDFGDNVISHEINPIHLFSSSGNHQVRLIASNCFGSDTSYKNIIVQENPLISYTPENFNLSLSCNSIDTLSLTIYNKGKGDLVFEEKNDPINLLALTYGVDTINTYKNTIHFIQSNLPNLQLSEINTDNDSILKNALIGNDVLLIPSQQNWSKPAIFSNFAPVLLNFINQGGSVIYCGTSNTDCITNTGLLTSSIDAISATGTLYAIDEQHPIVKNINMAFSTTLFTYYLHFTDPDIKHIIDYGYSSVVAYREINKGKIIYIGFDYTKFDTNTTRIIANAVKFGANNFYENQFILNPLKDTLSAGDSIKINVIVNDSGLTAGKYEKEFQLSTNDSLHSHLIIPVTINISGSPNISLTDSIIEFENVFLNYQKADSIFIKNKGCDTLIINDIQCKTAYFSTNKTSLVIEPGKTTSLIVYFKPKTTGIIKDTLFFINNDQMASILLSGICIDTPIIHLSIDTFHISIPACSDSITIPFYIINKGGSELYLPKPKVAFLDYGIYFKSYFENTLKAIDMFYNEYNASSLYPISANDLERGLKGKDAFLIPSIESDMSQFLNGDINNILHSYLSNGGNIIFCGSKANTDFFFQTGLLTGNYENIIMSDSILFTTHDITHPISKDIEEITSQQNTHVLNITNSDVQKLISFKNNDIVSYRNIGKGKLIYIAYDYSIMDINTSRIIANTLKWACNKNFPSWMNVDIPTDKTIQPNDSLLVPISFNSKKCNAGIYTYPLPFTSNDPHNLMVYAFCSLQVEQNLCADFKYEITACTGDVLFTDQSINNPLTWEWNFGDGSISHLQHPIHTYTKKGSYTIKLIVSNQYGSDTTTSILNINPFYLEIETDYAPCCGTQIYFYTDTLNLTTCLWDFGDGETSNQKLPIHVYDSIGTYIVSLNAENSDGCHTVAYKTITISPFNLNDIKQENLFIILPNPNNGLFTINYNGLTSMKVNIGIRNAAGQLILNETANFTRGTKKQVNIKQYTKGIYYLFLDTENQRIIKKISYQ